jgi:hypothetical protein
MTFKSPITTLALILSLIAIAPLNLISAAGRETASAAPADSVVENDDGAEMEAVVAAIREALQQSQNVKIADFPVLSGVKLELNTVVTKTTGGKIKFLIFSFGKTKSTESSSTVTVELTAPKPQGATSSVDPTKLTKALAQAIVEAKQSFVAAAKIDPRLTQSKVTLAFKFQVKTQTSGSVTITDIIPVGLEGSGDLSKAQVHTITLTFT